MNHADPRGISHVQKCRRAFLAKGTVRAETLKQAVAWPVAETAESQCVWTKHWIWWEQHDLGHVRRQSQQDMCIIAMIG